jgi:predicted PurR-regulated permease PerM
MLNQKFLLHISWNSLIKIVVVAVVIYLLLILRDILAFFIAALIISILFEPLINFFYTRKASRLASVTIVYLGFLGIFIFIIGLFLPLFFTELRLFFDRLTRLPQVLEHGLVENGLFQQIAPYIEPFLTAVKREIAEIRVLDIIYSIIAGITSISFVIILSFFFSLENREFKKLLKLFFPKKHEHFITYVWDRATKKISLWFGIRLIGCLFIGAATFLTLLLLGSPHPIILSLIAGIFNFIPFVGPIISAIFIAAILFNLSPLLSIIFIGIFILLQFLENNVFSVVLIKKRMHVPSFIILLSVVIGLKLWGVIGAILIVPFIAIVFEFLKEFLEKKRLEEEQRPKLPLQQSLL